jgi:gallate dioxygenase
MALDKPYLNIPGTIIFDAEQSRKGYWLNQFCMSLMRADNRARFKADQRAYLNEWPMSEDQRQAVLDMDLNRAMALGGQHLLSGQDWCHPRPELSADGWQHDRMSEQEYRAMMIAGGRSIEGNRVIGDTVTRKPITNRRVQPALLRVRLPPQQLRQEASDMARINAAVFTSHVPAIGAAMDLGKTHEPYWQPLFKGYRFFQTMDEGQAARRDFSGLQRHATAFSLDMIPTFCHRHGG